MPGGPSAELEAGSFQELLAAIGALRDATRVADWAACERGSANALALGSESSRRLESLRLHEKARARQMGSRHRRLGEALREIARSERGPALFASLSDRIDAERRDAFEGSLVKLGRGETAGVALLEALLGESARALPRQRDLEGDVIVAAITQGVTGLVHVAFNHGLAHGEKTRAKDAGLLEALTAATDELTQRLRSGQRRIHSELATGSVGDATSASEAARVLAEQLQGALPGFAAAQATACSAYRHALSEGQGAAADALGRALAKAGLLTRIGLASLAASHRLALEAACTAPRDDAREAMTRAAGKAFEGPLPSGRETPLSELAQSDPETPIEVCGVVSRMSVARLEGDFLITRLQIEAPVDGATANAIVRFAHLPHAGLTQGAFIRLSGVHRHASRFHDGEPAIEVDQLELARLAKDDWTISFIRLAERWITPWRTGANVAWSLGPHRGVDDDTGEPMGAGELFFTRALKV